MCIIKDVNGNEDVEWLNKDDVDEPGNVSHSVSDPAAENGHELIESVETWIEVPWSSDQ